MASNEMGSNKISVSFNLWWLVGLLGLVILVMLALWRPWQGTSGAPRTVTVTGETTLKAEPDEFVFNPTWEFKNNDKATALSEVSAKSDTVVAELKKLGVADKDIKSNTGGWNGYYWYDGSANQHVYNLNITATVSSRDKAQKVQDYLVSTEPTGQVSPQSNFSESLRKKLESEGREKATKDARAKADEMAKNLGFKVGKVVSVNDTSTGAGYPMPMLSMASEDAKVSSLAVQPGQDELSYSVSVEYTIR